MCHTAMCTFSLLMVASKKGVFSKEEVPVHKDTLALKRFWFDLTSIRTLKLGVFCFADLPITCW